MILKRIKQLAKKNQRGFTLIELLLYISLVTIFLSGAIRFSWDVIYSREKAYSQRIVNQAASTAMLRISREIRLAENITSVSTNQIVLNNGGVATTINLNGTTLEISPGGAGPYTLTSNQVRVTSLTFINTSSTNINSKGISIEITVEQASLGTSEQFVATNTISQSIELNKNFNHSRTLLVDLTSIEILNNNKISGITFQNIGTNDLTITDMYITWTGLAGTENITGIRIGGGPTEWTGTAGPGTTIDITDYPITPADDIVDLDYLQFDSAMDNASLFMNIILADGSIHKTAFTLPDGVTPTPTPSPTPTPTPTPTPSPTPDPTSCLEVCQNLTYSTSTCRKNPNTCSQNGETHESSGNTFCTGGNNADTCCCAP